MKEDLERLALSLVDKRLMLSEGPFQFKLHEEHPRAPRSPIKVNLRFPPKGNLTWQSVEEIANIFYQVSCQNQLQYDCVVGVPKAGDPFAETFSKLASVPFLTLQKEETITKRRVLPILQGEYQKGWRVLIIDDTVVMADSKFEAIKAIEANGLIVAAILILVDWQHGGREDLKRAGYLVIPVFLMTELLTFYLKELRISVKKYQEVLDYLGAIRAYFNRQ